MKILHSVYCKTELNTQQHNNNASSSQQKASSLKYTSGHKVKLVLAWPKYI